MGSECETFDYLYQSFLVVRSQVLMTVYQLRMKLHIPPPKQKHLTSCFSDVHWLQQQQSKFICFDKINDCLEE